MSQSKEERVHKVFESISEKYDVMNSVISFRQHVAWRKDTMKRMNVQTGANGLDVCCGTADWTIALARAVGESGDVIGLDFSKNMLAIGEKKVNEAQLTNVKLIHGNAMELPFPNDYFQYVTIGFGLRNVPDYMQVLKEMYRVLKPGGTIACLETSKPTAPVIKQVYFFYFKHIMPLLGKVFAKSYEQYSWLQESTIQFPDRFELAQMFAKAGFEDVFHKAYFFGAAALHMATKEGK